MTRLEFTEELDRLAAGLSESMTAERAHALYHALSHYYLPDWRACVDRCLCQFRRFPSLDQMIGELDKIRAAERQRRRWAHDTIFHVDPEDMTEAYGKFRIQLIKDSLAGKMTPAQVGEELRKAAERFPNHAQPMLDEAKELVSMASWTRRANEHD